MNSITEVKNIIAEMEADAAKAATGVKAAEARVFQGWGKIKKIATTEKRTITEARKTAKAAKA